MATISFYARGDSNSANNAALNAQNTNTVPTTEITFSSGVSGDLQLETNGGAPDPDTTIIINGVEMTFTVNFSGALPNTNKLSNVNGVDLRGEPIVVITTEDGQRLFFLPNGVSQATMDAFPNGAHDLDAVTTVDDVPVCFVAGTEILTPRGHVLVEELMPGDLVTTYGGKTRQLRWIASRYMSFSELLVEPRFRPVCLPAGFLGRDGPHKPLWLSPQHRFLFRGWEAELLFRNAEVFVPAASCRDLPGAPVADISQGVAYYHLFLDCHDVLIANGLPCESLFPGDGAIASLTEAARAELAALFPEHGGNWAGYGPTARQSLSRKEGDLLLAYSGLDQARSEPEQDATGFAVQAA
ncbi:Hint domain-containing protein [Shimia sediminis]|uniref:Hint domain-containing protein n=1 Tax=Shimia sediminis TaxID=2497945 RepID=UPI000F8F5C7A|nr:Hint domain-containing protein [Shimia sediminis]